MPGELGGVDAALAGKALGSLRGGTGLVEGDACGGATLDLVELLGREGDVVDVRDEPPRRLVRLDLSMGEARLVETLAHKVPELDDGVVQRRGWHLLAADLK